MLVDTPTLETGESARPRRSLPVLARGAGRSIEHGSARGPVTLDPAREVGSAPLPRSVRISVTDRCDYACTYCRPSRHDGYVQEGRLLPEEWRHIIDALMRAGVRRVRLTGGEPLLHPAILSIVEHLASLDLEDLAMTTNASRLRELAGPLRRAGLRRLNISIDSLDPAVFAELTRGGRLDEVLSGVDAALAEGFESIKLNTVVLRGKNDGELEDLLLWAWGRRMVPRFLELMPIAEGAKLGPGYLVTAREMMDRLAVHLTDEAPHPEPDRGPAKYVRARRDPALRVGFITGTSDTFCSTCDRLRVSSTGVLRPCLATDEGLGAADLARAGDVAGIEARIAAAWAMKPDGKTWKGCTEDSAQAVSMRAIGG